MNRSIHSKFLAFLLALVMVFSMLPVTAFAEDTVTYTKVTEALDDWTGEYLLVYEEQGFALDGSLETVDAANNYVGVTIAANAIQTTDHSYAVYAEAVEGGYVLKTASGKYIYHSSDANKISTTTNRDTAAKYPITFLISRIAGKLSHMVVPNAFSIPQKACHNTVIISIKIVIITPYNTIPRTMPTIATTVPIPNDTHPNILFLRASVLELAASSCACSICLRNN